MNPWTIVGGISTLFGLLGLIFYIVYRIQELNSNISLTPELVKELKKIDLDGIDIETLKVGSLKEIIKSSNEISNSLIDVAITPEIQNKRRNSLIITILLFLIAVTFFTIDYYFSPTTVNNVDNQSINLIGWVKIDDKLQNKVRVSLPWQSKADITNLEGKFSIAGVDTSNINKMVFVFDTIVDTTIIFKPGELDNNMTFEFRSKKIKSEKMVPPVKEHVVKCFFNYPDGFIRDNEIVVRTKYEKRNIEGGFELTIPEGEHNDIISFTISGPGIVIQTHEYSVIEYLKSNKPLEVEIETIAPPPEPKKIKGYVVEFNADREGGRYNVQSPAEIMLDTKFVIYSLDGPVGNHGIHTHAYCRITANGKIVAHIGDNSGKNKTGPANSSSSTAILPNGLGSVKCTKIDTIFE